jgi:hypothetical protein
MDLSNLSSEIFQFVWLQSQITDYDQIVNIINTYPNIEHNLYPCLEEITINGHDTIVSNIEYILNKIKNEVPQTQITLTNMIFLDLSQLLKLVRVYPQIVKLDLKVIPCSNEDNSETYNNDDDLLLLKIITTMKENNRAKINVKFYNALDLSIILSYDGTNLIYNSTLVNTDNQMMQRAIVQYINYIRS